MVISFWAPLGFKVIKRQLYYSIPHEIAQEEKDENIFYCLIINKIQIQYGRDRTPASYFRVVYVGECVYQENVSDKWDIPQLYHEKGFHSCLSTFSRVAVKLPDTDIENRIPTERSKSILT